MQHGLPVLAQNVKAHLAREVDVRVVDFGLADNQRRAVRIVVGDRDVKLEAAPGVESVLGPDRHAEVKQVRRPVRPLEVRRRRDREILDIVEHAALDARVA
eukprot:Amastigsp_a841725_289.p5 type:complete len:101 gc:universal Amastigsp_a841725_289:790-1092(+)